MTQYEQLEASVMKVMETLDTVIRHKSAFVSGQRSIARDIQERTAANDGVVSDDDAEIYRAAAAVSALVSLNVRDLMNIRDELTQAIIEARG